MALIIFHSLVLLGERIALRLSYWAKCLKRFPLQKLLSLRGQGQGGSAQVWDLGGLRIGGTGMPVTVPCSFLPWSPIWGNLRDSIKPSAGSLVLWPHAAALIEGKGEGGRKAHRGESTGSPRGG